jgi:hypothetical protein
MSSHSTLFRDRSSGAERVCLVRPTMPWIIQVRPNAADQWSVRGTIDVRSARTVKQRQS